MDDEDTSSYKEPCPQCSEVNWGISDECKYYCKSCHTVIEKTKEVQDFFAIQNTKVQSISRGLRKKKAGAEVGWDWYVCEGFQFVLLKQAEALEALGISPDIKDHVMCNLWRLYLQKTKQAYCKRPVIQRPMQVVIDSSGGSSELDSESDAYDTQATSESDMEAPSVSSAGLPSSGECTQTSDAESVISAVSVQSGSVDGGSYLKKKTWERKMSMPMTLAFCYLSLLWVRASITLSDLLRLVFYHHIPYYNPQQYFPEKMKLYGRDINIFEIQNFPEHHKILELSKELGTLLALAPFPPITETCYYHPNVLCMKYLMEVNLPDELHNWTCCVANKAGLDDVAVLTYHPRLKGKRLIPYDIQAVAIIVVTLKFIFVLDDDFEWQLAKYAEKKNQEGNGITIFDFQKWYMTMKPCMDEANLKLEEEKARFSWESDRIMAYTRKEKARLLKRKRMANNLQNRFGRLAGAAPDAGNQRPSSFLFNWEEPNTGKICFHGHSLEGVAQKSKKQSLSPGKNYWLNTLKKCSSTFCKHWKLYDESLFPSSYRFVISLFSTVLRVEPSLIHYEVSLVEGKIVSGMPTTKPTKKLRKKRI
ncbi:TATA box-binding protein-associated factor RNA polymerase I subunit B [Dendropsophus ebraccatus]|uniref:TATA box-binding protein-associated factor RNA polymerase I subunit B n=1 Tax=Dendropsophus ebraccatus TaxID=150705 RepID=UPI003831D586